MTVGKMFINISFMNLKTLLGAIQTLNDNKLECSKKYFWRWVFFTCITGDKKLTQQPVSMLDVLAVIS